MKVQSDQKTVASKTKILDHMKASISHTKKCMLKPVEKVDSKYKINQKVLEECKKLGTFRHSSLVRKCQLSLKPTTPDSKVHC